ncbi:MAG: metal-dependent hydrolase [Bacteroidota bacterium]
MDRYKKQGIMATAFAHAIVGYTIAKTKKDASKLLIGVSVVSAFFPDMDVFLHNFGVSYADMFGHRGFSHSIFFGLLWAGLMLLIFKKLREVSSFLILFLSTISHGLIDTMTTGGHGIGLLIPFVNERYFAPDALRVIEVSSMRITRFFSNTDRLFEILKSEFIWIFVPCIILLSVIRILRNGN